MRNTIEIVSKPNFLDESRNRKTTKKRLAKKKTILFSKTLGGYSSSIEVVNENNENDKAYKQLVQQLSKFLCSTDKNLNAITAKTNVSPLADGFLFKQVYSNINFHYLNNQIEKIKYLEVQSNLQHWEDSTNSLWNKKHLIYSNQNSLEFFDYLVNKFEFPIIEEDFLGFFIMKNCENPLSQCINEHLNLMISEIRIYFKLRFQRVEKLNHAENHVNKNYNKNKKKKLNKNTNDESTSSKDFITDQYPSAIILPFKATCIKRNFLKAIYQRCVVVNKDIDYQESNNYEHCYLHFIVYNDDYQFKIFDFILQELISAADQTTEYGSVSYCMMISIVFLKRKLNNLSCIVSFLEVGELYIRKFQSISAKYKIPIEIFCCPNK